MHKKLLATLLAIATFALPLSASATIAGVQNGGTGVGTLSGIPFGNGVSPFGTLTIGTGLSLVGSTLTATGGGAGGSGGTFSTTTSQVTGRFINYPNNSTDIVNIGSTSTTTGKFYFDPNLPLGVFNSPILHLASTTMQAFTFTNATGTNATTTNLFATTASTTNLFGSGLASCSGANALSWVAGLFGCVAIPQGTVTAVTGTANRITSTGGATPQLDISSSYVGQASITTVGTLSSGAVPASLITAGTFGAGNYIFPAQLQVNSSTTLQAFTATNSTTTSATTTNFFATTASTSNLFGANLATCNGTTNALSWTAGLFGCGTIAPPASAITGGQALTKTDDTNVTLTLGGSPSTALLAATSLTLGWTGTLADSRVADNLTISGGTINSTPIGATTPSTVVSTNSTSTNATTTNSFVVATDGVVGAPAIKFGVTTAGGVLPGAYDNSGGFGISAAGTGVTYTGTAFQPNTDDVRSLGSSVNRWLQFWGDLSTTSQATTTNLSVGTLFRSGTTDGCGTWAGGVLGSTGSACGSGGGSSYPFPLAGNATSTLVGFNGGFIGTGSSTIANLSMTTATATSATTTNLAIASTLSKLLLTDGNGVVSGYTAQACTNQFVRGLSALGVPTCNSVAIGTDVSGLGANVATFLATPSSANFAAAVTGETGTGNVVFSADPVFTGTPTFQGFLSQSSTTISSLTVTNGTTTNATSTNLFATNFNAVNSSTTNATSTSFALTGTSNTPVLAAYSASTNSYDFSTASIWAGGWTSKQLFTIGTTTPTWTFTVASTSPTLELDDTNGATNQKHLTMNFDAGVFRIATSSDTSLFATSSALFSLDITQPYSELHGTSTPTTGLTFDLFTNNATSSMRIDTNSTTKGTCLVMKDTDGVGYTYVWANNGVLTASQTSCL